MKNVSIVPLLFLILAATTPLLAQSEDVSLVHFVHVNDINKVRELLSKKVGLTEKDDKGRTAIGRACEDGHEEILGLLLEAGADPNLVSKKQTPLMIAAYANKPNILQILLDRGVQINGTNKARETALMKAVAGAAPDAVKLLLEKGAEVHARRVDGWTALTFAVWLQQHDIALMLMEKGAPLDSKVADGRTLVAIARENNDDRMIEILKKAGAPD